MSGTKLGGIRARNTNLAKYGDNFYGRIGSVGGHARVPKGFAKMTKAKRRAAGIKGGSASRRLPTLKPSLLDRLRRLYG